ncbi:MAG: hemerythrin domain-containing protein, partial [Massilibacteroides sp.]|nr:hemerythrin domain-containing protein [Massilibacteroides sp.]
MKASEDLRKEHELIITTLNVLDKVVDKIELGEKVDATDLKDIVVFLSEFADKCHHGKEEGFYFPALERAGIPNEGGPIGV